MSVHDGDGAAGPHRLGQLERLVADVRYTSEMRGPHDVRIDVFAPRGTLYAQLTGSVDLGADGSGTTSLEMEVQGTAIESFRQLGRWRFVLAVDEGAPVASSEVDLVE
jgi:hypothetical protein